MASRDSPPLWAPKLAQQPLRRLYESDAQGRLDDTLLIEVGSALYSRCLSIILVTSRHVICSCCHETFATNWQWDKRSDKLHIVCPHCHSWEITGAQYRQSVEHDNLAALMALPIFQSYVAAWPLATTPPDRMRLIDRLIHDFHWGLKQQAIPHRSTANNLIEGSHDAVIAFLDQLSYGDASTAELRTTHAEWRDHAQQMQRLRQAPRQQRANLLSPNDETTSEA